MPKENVEAVRRMMDAWATGQFSAGAEDLDAEVQFIVASTSPRRLRA